MAATGYSKPPIVEAAIEFRFVERLSPRDLERLRERFRSKFPKIEDQQKIEVAVTPQGIKTNATPVGSKMTAANAVDIVIIQEDLFNSIRLAPYDGWEKFIATAKENYELFTKVADRRTISRIGSRFINRLDIPVAEMKDIDILEFIRFGVAMPEEMSKTIGPFSVAANFQADGVKVLAQCGVIAPALLDHLSVVLDIDVFVDSDIKPHKDAIWEVAGALRAMKNRVFEASITDRVRARFK